jgi:hypothetical protein
LACKTLAENADWRAAFNWLNFETFTLEIAHMTMKSAIRSVIMSL